MKTLILKAVIILCITLSAKPQDVLSQTDAPKFVINRFGTPLMSKPDIQSDTLKLIKPGVKINGTSTAIQLDSVRYPGNKITLVGHWLKSGINGDSGYIFSADLSVHQPIVSLEENDYDQIIYAVNMLGQKTDSTETTRKVEYSADNFVDFTENSFTYQYGKSEEYWFDGCFYQSFYLEGWNLNEAFHLMRSKMASYGMHYQKGFHFNTPILERMDEYNYQFKMNYSATEDVTISYDRETNMTSMRFDSCT